MLISSIQTKNIAFSASSHRELCVIDSDEKKKQNTDNNGVYAINWDGRWIKYRSQKDAGNAFGIAKSSIQNHLNERSSTLMSVAFVKPEVVEEKTINQKALVAFLKNAQSGDTVSVDSLFETKINQEKIEEIAANIRKTRPNPFNVLA